MPHYIDYWGEAAETIVTYVLPLGLVAIPVSPHFIGYGLRHVEQQLLTETSIQLEVQK